ncbi:hypothetical protein BC830DRAFT_525122 [Chytriomyces sp. MP71]|nr:hypothetical protein BC830DRAFT_525122 [Chytriomyces sp. MP71]
MRCALTHTRSISLTCRFWLVCDILWNRVVHAHYLRQKTRIVPCGLMGLVISFAFFIGNDAADGDCGRIKDFFKVDSTTKSSSSLSSFSTSPKITVIAIHFAFSFYFAVDCDDAWFHAAVQTLTSFSQLHSPCDRLQNDSRAMIIKIDLVQMKASGLGCWFFNWANILRLLS